jgi:phenylpyruvate tautomerase PptA (4-oxalocrotonate tautomerase family)
MPLIYINCPENTFSAAAKDALADELTTIALAAEQLPDTPFVRSTVWIYIHEYPAATVYHGGKLAGTRVISLEVNAFAGGHTNASKQVLIYQFTVYGSLSAPHWPYEGGPRSRVHPFPGCA